jgi:uncharacterized protein
MDEQQFWFVSDLHGKISRYEKLFENLEKDPPEVLLIGGDFLPSHVKFKGGIQGFIEDYLHEKLVKLKKTAGKHFPLILLIFGNDDPRVFEEEIEKLQSAGLLQYMHNRLIQAGNYNILGYSYVPPTPFQLKDWERYDVSRFVDPGCIPPEEGRFTVTPLDDVFNKTIKEDLDVIAEKLKMEKTIVLFHSPPYKTNLDRAALDGMMIDHVPLDLHVGSIAISRFIEASQPLITLHGHIHESARIMGDWKDRIGNTWCMSAATEGDELAIVKFNPNEPSQAERFIL